MTPDEVRLLDNQYAILFIRGERPVLDLKYDMFKHPNIGLIADGGMQQYHHGTSNTEIASVEIISVQRVSNSGIGNDMPESNYELLSEKELEEIFNIN